MVIQDIFGKYFDWKQLQKYLYEMFRCVRHKRINNTGRKYFISCIFHAYTQPKKSGKFSKHEEIRI